MNKVSRGSIVEVTGYIHSNVFVFNGNGEISETLKEGVIGKIPNKGKFRRLIHQYELPTPITGMVIGWTTRRTGEVFETEEGGDEYGGGSVTIREFEAIDTVKCWMVMPIDQHDNNRYRKPLVVLENQMKELINGKQ